jgi:hypothetical protein
MLKIKDNINLNELERYGFVKTVDEGHEYWNYSKINEEESAIITVYGDDKHIELYISWDYTSSNGVDEVMYDLTNDGLIEKMKD